MTHEFGGDWTGEKLAVVRSYFESYSVALKNMPFECWYVDAFAGSGERIDSAANTMANDQFFGEDIEDVRQSKDGSARIALQIEPAFARYIFIESSQRRAAQLGGLNAEFPELDIEVVAKDANDFLIEFAKAFPRNVRAAIFIDPYGMQVRWETLKALARTGYVDIALLFPTGPLNRLLRRDANLPNEWVAAIETHLGQCDWRNAMYRPQSQRDLFGDDSAREKAVTVSELQNFVLERLQSIFAYVHPEAVSLRNSKRAILYDLFILTANSSPAAIALAKRLAASAIRVSRSRN